MRIIYTDIEKDIYGVDVETFKVVIPAKEFENKLELVAARCVPAGLSFQIVEDSAVPSDRTFRNAWKSKAGGVDVDMIKARNIWREKIRQARAVVMAQNDVALQNALADNDQQAKAAAIALRNKLRDMPQDARIDAAKTPDELKAVWFAELG